LAALVLTVLTFGPSLDTYICGDEGGMSAAAAGQAAAAAPDQPESLDGHDKALGACAHGHCHHGAAYTPVEVPPCQERPRLTAKHNLLRLAVRSSDPKFGLMRPPRA
jgi:hypothetical protein